MGQAAECQLDVNAIPHAGQAQLESDQLILRFDGRRVRIAFRDLTAVAAEHGRLMLRTAAETFVLHLGPAAAIWSERIQNPRSRMEKLGVQPGDRVLLAGETAGDFCAELARQTDQIGGAPPFDWVFFTVATPAQLAALTDFARQITPTGAVWVVAPKGKGSPVPENQVRAAGLAAGLVDTKVVGFSPTHTALRFVIPRSRRQLPV